ncbi:MAG TPA: ABC transporter substrate-binding protein [Acidimicrobiia bacterium]|nr:ABC transporter substrate-binding protein [Acidimicrobiia bacterium]
MAGVALATGLALISAVPAGASGQSRARQGTAGDTIVLGAEQEPDCADWIGSCAGASWGVWTMQAHTMPRVFEIVKQGKVWVYEASNLVASEPTVETVDGKQTVTYEINPDAVWSDGEPITSSDFLYTWDQIANGEDIYDATGYDKIEGVDDSDPSTAVVTYADPYGGWKGLFGGAYGVLPSHILEGTDRTAAMVDGYSWSGGPFIIESWERGVSVTLVPNDAYWGDKAKSTVVFQFITDTAAEFQAFKAGEVLAIYPQPQIDVVEAIDAGIPDAESAFTGDTGNLEALWINMAEAPFDSEKFRQAFAYAIDRDALVKRLFGGLGINKAVNSLNPPIQSAFSDTKAFAKYKLNLKKVDSLMKADGWKKNDDGVWEKDGEPAEIEIRSTTGNQRRELTEQILQDQLAKAGFDLVINNQAAGDLFGQQLPDGDFQLALYAQVVTTLDPGLCVILCSSNIPTEDNDFSGQNFTRTDVAGLDDPLEAIDGSFDDEEKAKLGKKADRIMAKAMISLPLDPLPNIALWSKTLSGPKGDHPVFSVFVNLAEWELT